MGVLTRRRQDEIRAYCRLAQGEGLSVRRALNDYRLAGGKVRTADFLALWQQAAAEKVNGG